MIGQRFGRLTLSATTERRNGKHCFRCLCDCGAEKVVRLDDMKSGKVVSCGCLALEKLRVRNAARAAAVETQTRTCLTCGVVFQKRKNCGASQWAKRTACSMACRVPKHGDTLHPDYQCWYGMIQRCTVPKTSGFENYGGRGIGVCDRWKGSFRSFIEDLGPRPSSRHTIERVDVNGNYEPSNCRWATWTEQGRNKRSNHLVEFGGESLPVSVWAERTGIRADTILFRVKSGWPIADALTRSPDKAFKVRKRTDGGSGNSRLTAESVLEIRRRKAAGVPTATIAAEFGVTKSNVHCIVARKSWAHVA